MSGKICQNRDTARRPPRRWYPTIVVGARCEPCYPNRSARGVPSWPACPRFRVPSIRDDTHIWPWAGRPRGHPYRFATGSNGCQHGLWPPLCGCYRMAKWWLQRSAGCQLVTVRVRWRRSSGSTARAARGAVTARMSTYAAASGPTLAWAPAATARPAMTMLNSLEESMQRRRVLAQWGRCRRGGRPAIPWCIWWRCPRRPAGKRGRQRGQGGWVGL
jgi:hypothetical protein